MDAVMTRWMEGREADGTPYTGTWHGARHKYDSVCEGWPKCVPAEPTQEEAEVPEEWTTKDSGQRVDFPSGMRRDIQSGKARFDLIFPDGIPYEEQILTRFAGLLARGAEKYGENNWQLANSVDELNRFRASALRHMIQWATGEKDEDHATAVLFNLMAYEHCKRKIDG